MPPVRRFFECVLTILLVLAGNFPVAAGADSESGTLDAKARHPIAVVTVPGGLLVVNERSGSVSRLDLAGRKVLWEQSLEGVERPVAIAAVGAETFVLADHARHQLVRVALTDHGLEEQGRSEVVRWPVSIAPLRSGELAVAGLWSRRVEFLAPSTDSPCGFQRSAVVALPFNPRKLVPIGADRLLVADGFGGRLAVIDVPKRRVESVRTIQAHSIRGLATDPAGTSLYLAHQMLDERAATTHENVSLGILLSNLVRRIPLAAILDPQANLESVSSRYFLGRTLEGAADPNGLAFDAHGRLWVALGGTSELCEVSSDGVEIRRVPVGVRPTEILSAGNSIIALETFGDGVALLDPAKSASPPAEISLGPPRSLTRAEQGERLFYNGRLSLESWMSCNSCHPDGHTHGLVADTAGDGGFGNPKRTLSLLGTRDANPWAWNGQFRELSEQVQKSVTSSMQGPPVSLEQTVDIVTFLHTLKPPPPVDEPGAAANQAEIARGRALFQTLGCAGCHIPPLTYTTDAMFDVGIHDERGQVKFNPPTLRGVAQRDRLFHDNRAASLEAVFDEFGHQLPRRLEPGEQTDLLRFLRSL